MWKYALAILFATTAFSEESKWSIGYYLGAEMDGRGYLVDSFAVGYQVSPKTRFEVQLNSDVSGDENTRENHRTIVHSTDIGCIYQLRDSDIKIQPIVGAGLGYGSYNLLPPNYYIDTLFDRNPTYERKKAVHFLVLTGVETDIFNRWRVGAILRHAVADGRHTTSMGLNLRVKF